MITTSVQTIGSGSSVIYTASGSVSLTIVNLSNSPVAILATGFGDPAVITRIGDQWQVHLTVGQTITAASVNGYAMLGLVEV